MEERNSPIVFNEWLKRRRKTLDLTQAELAKRAGCSVGALRKIESGDRRPSKQLAELLAKALELSKDEQPIFIRVARGERNLERLKRPALESVAPLSEVASLPRSQIGASSGKKPSPAPMPRIPVQVTPLIGRETELAGMERIFNDPRCRLLTLTGVGGIGKTRLAIEFASRNLPVFPGGVFYIPLTPVNSSEKIVSAIADVLEFGFSGPADPKNQLINYLSSSIQQDALFVFDNLEQLLVPISMEDEKSGLVELVSEILQRLPQVKILGTSRERLNMHGEWTYEVQGLSVPPTHFVGRLEEYDSVALFVNSAQRMKTDFQLTADEQLPIVRVCQLVEGVPLAIELAAAWVGMLSCQEIAQEIQSNMDFLTSSMRDVPERHRSIRATFDHSWKLLSEEERRALCRLSVFQGGFDRSAADQIAGAGLPILASLSAKSLVRRAEDGRFDLHEVIRQYALAHLDEQALKQATYARHCDYYLNMLREREKSLKNSAQQDVMRELTVEIDNIRAAWIWAIEHRKFQQLEQAGRAFGWYFEISGLYSEGIEQLERLVKALNTGPKDHPSQKIIGQALVSRALLHFRKGEFEHAQRLYEEGLVILRPTGDLSLLADALIFSGTLHYLMGEYQTAYSRVEEGLAFARAAKDLWFEAFGIFSLGFIASLLGHSEESYPQMLAGLEAWRALGDPQAIALGLNFTIPPMTRLGLYQEAKTFMMESIALCEQTKNLWGLGTAYRFLGLALLAEGHYLEAQAQLRRSLEVFGEDFVGWDIARTRSYLADAVLKSGDFSQARKEYLHALRISIESNAMPIALDVLSGLSELQTQAGKPENALMLCTYVLNHPAGEEETKSRAAQLVRELEDRLTPDQARAARAAAQALTLDSILEEMLVR